MKMLNYSIAAKDASATAAMRTAFAEHAIDFTAPETRKIFDVIISMTPVVTGLTYERAIVGGVPGWWCRPAEARSGAVLLYLHGGAYVVGSAQAYRNFVGQIVERTGTTAFIADYRLAPEHPFPAAFDDALAVYDGLVAAGARKIMLVGDSAGGGLSLALLARVTKLAITGGLAPIGAVVMSPWTDLALTAPTMQTNAEADPLLTKGALAAAANLYLIGQDAADPSASPLYGSLVGLPPVRIDVGSTEILLDDARRYAEKASEAGTDVTLAVWEGMFHVFPSSVGQLIASGLALDAQAAFILERLETA